MRHWYSILKPWSNQNGLEMSRAVARPLIGGGRGGGAYSYIRVLPDGFLLKAIVFTVCEHEYTPLPPPIIVSSDGPGNESFF